MSTIDKKRNPVIGETVPIECVAVKNNGDRLDLTSATIWLTLKTSDALADASATIQIETLHESDQFTISTPATIGEFIVELSAVNTATLAAGTIYYVDIKIRDQNGKMYYIAPKQQLVFDNWITRATVES